MLGSIAFNYWMAIAVDRAHGTPARARRCSALAIAVNLVVLGVFKYANFFADNVNALLAALGAPAARRAARAAADRHLVLHVSRDLVRRRRLPARRDRRRRARCTRRSTCCSFRSSSPDRSSATATSPISSRGGVVSLDDFAVRRPPLRHRPRQEGADRQRRRRPGRSDLRACRSRELDAGPRLARHRLLHAADLLRLLRLLRHGDRPRPDVRLPLSRELPLALHRRHASRSSGAAGTSRCRPGSATTSTSRSAATASARRGRTAISSRCSSCAACGTARAGTS